MSYGLPASSPSTYGNITHNGKNAPSHRTRRHVVRTTLIIYYYYHHYRRRRRFRAYAISSRPPRESSGRSTSRAYYSGAFTKREFQLSVAAAAASGAVAARRPETDTFRAFEETGNLKTIDRFSILIRPFLRRGCHRSRRAQSPNETHPNPRGTRLKSYRQTCGFPRKRSL